MGKLEDNLKKAMKSKSMKELMKSGKFKDADDKIKKIELDKMNNAMPKKGLAGGGSLKMVEKGGKKVPFFAADGKGKMMAGGKVKKMMGGGMLKPKKRMMGGGMTKIKYRGGGIVKQGVRPTKYV